MGKAATEQEKLRGRRRRGGRGSRTMSRSPTTSVRRAACLGCLDDDSSM
jgi:hypothetical protein